MEEKDYSGVWGINFTCPHCKKDAGIYAEEWCPITNDVRSFEIAGWEEDEAGNFVSSQDVDVDWGKSGIGEGEGSEAYFCDSCREEVDEDLHNKEQLFNWLFQKGMVQREEESNA
jgi:hypothetical protein